MKIGFTVETIRRPSFSSYKYDNKYRNVRVLGSRYSYESEPGEMTFEKVVIDDNAFVIIDGNRLVDLKTVMSMLNCLEVAGSEQLELWTREREEEVNNQLADAAAKAKADEAAKVAESAKEEAAE